MMQEVLISTQLESDLTRAINICAPDKVFVLTDDTTKQFCWPKLQHFECLKGANLISIKPTDYNKNIATLSQVWESLATNGATRSSCLINLGGGMVTDLGGFAAATFKRGIRFVNIPTTLLAMVDAAVGGKTGVNFNALKNEIGVFCNARFVVLNTLFLSTLDNENTRSGYAEMLKHALSRDVGMWSELVHCVLGHAVAFGLVCELYLATFKTHFPVNKMRQTVQFIREYYGTLPLSCNDYDQLIELMQHDKKNASKEINFTLLADIGQPIINQTASKEDFFRETI